MNYRPKVIECKLNFSNLTNEDVMKKCASKSEVEVVKEFYKKLDGTVLALALWEYDRYEDYHLYGWDDATDEKMMEATFVIENEFGVYHNFDEFKNEWKSGEYDSGGSIVFDKKFVKEIKVLCEEQKEIKQ